MLKRCLLLLVLLVLPVALAEPQIRVLIDSVSESTTVTMQGSHNTYLDGAFWFGQATGGSRSIQAISGQIYFDGQAVGQTLRFEPSEQVFNWAGKDYRGSLKFAASDNRLQVINMLDIEAYLQGVIPVEMKADWHIEALKAQAVAARTYVLAHLRSDRAYDVCATQGCQRYDGLSAEHPQSNQAVQATQGVVVMYQGDYAETFYHADSGGMLASSQEVWGNSLPYLVAHEDVSQTSPHRNWEVTLDASRMTSSLNNLGQSVGSVNFMRIMSSSASGRAAKVEIRGDAGSTTLSGKTLRQLLRGWGLKSTKFYMVGDLRLVGSGYGHGVGMSQYGAQALAKSGREYTQILGFYYPNTNLQRMGYAIADASQ